MPKPAEQSSDQMVLVSYSLLLLSPLAKRYSEHSTMCHAKKPLGYMDVLLLYLACYVGHWGRSATLGGRSIAITIRDIQK